MPARPEPIKLWGIAVVRITSELNEQITTVSINGSSNAVMPSDAGASVFTAACAMDAEPIPASFENNAR